MLMSHLTAHHQLTSPYASNSPIDIHRTSQTAKTSVRREDLRRLSAAGFPEPHHLLALDRRGYRSFKNATVHLCTQPLPPLSFRSCSTPGFTSDFVVCPELCFVQLGELLSLPQLVKAGNELCGRFGYWDSSGTLMTRGPITSSASLASFLRSLGRIRGKQHARAALNYVCDGAASPREAILAALFTLPRARGGYGLPKPKLNHRIAVSSTQRHLFKQAYYECDLYWPAGKIAIEYDSDQHHTGPERLARDAARRTALAMLGVEIATVTNRHLFDIAEMDQVAHVVARRIGKNLRQNQRYDAHARQRQLIAELVRPLS